MTSASESISGHFRALLSGEGGIADVTLEVTVCPFCQGDGLVVVGAYTTRTECQSCGRSALIGWTSHDVETVFLSGMSGT